MFQDFDLVVLDEVVLLVAQRYRQDVLAAGRFQQREEAYSLQAIHLMESRVSGSW